MLVNRSVLESATIFRSNEAVADVIARMVRYHRLIIWTPYSSCACPLYARPISYYIAPSRTEAAIAFSGYVRWTVSGD